MTTRAVKALSIRQPWAWLVVAGHKDVENRNWATKHRGLLLIHASKTFDTEGLEWVSERFPELEWPDDFHRGGIIGSARLVDCVTKHESPWFFGPHGFVFADPRPMRFHRARGFPGLFVPEMERVAL